VTNLNTEIEIRIQNFEIVPFTRQNGSSEDDHVDTF
jgi:hypothetical protein